MSIVSFVDKVNSPFAPNVELFVLMSGKMLCLPCLKIDLSVWMLHHTYTHTHTLVWDYNIAQDRIGNRSFQITCTGVHSHANLWSLLLQISFSVFENYTLWCPVFVLFVLFCFSISLGAIMNTIYLQIPNQAGMIDTFLNGWKWTWKLWCVEDVWKPVEDLHKIKVVSAPVCQNIIWNCLHVFNVSVCVCVCLNLPVSNHLLYCMWED